MPVSAPHPPPPTHWQTMAHLLTTRCMTTGLPTSMLGKLRSELTQSKEALECEPMHLCYNWAQKACPELRISASKTARPSAPNGRHDAPKYCLRKVEFFGALIRSIFGPKSSHCPAPHPPYTHWHTMAHLVTTRCMTTGLPTSMLGKLGSELTQSKEALECEPMHLCTGGPIALCSNCGRVGSE